MLPLGGELMVKLPAAGLLNTRTTCLWSCSQQSWQAAHKSMMQSLCGSAAPCAFTVSVCQACCTTGNQGCAGQTTCEGGWLACVLQPLWTQDQLTI